ncbi:MAG: hypothetical protein WD066_06090 [Planctomycetaceae bacterium]
MVHVIVEGETDRVLIERLLEDLHDTAEFVLVVAGGRNAGRPLARKILLLDGAPVAFVFDTDSSDADRSRETERELRSYFRLWQPSPPILLVPMMPSIECLIVDHPEILESRLGRKLESIERDAGRFEPKGFLKARFKELGVESIPDLFRSLTSSEIEILQADKRIEKLRQFVQKHALVAR